MNERLEQNRKFTPPQRKRRGRLIVIASILAGAAMGLQVSDTPFAQDTAKAPIKKPAPLPVKDQPVIAFGGYGGGAQIPEPVLPLGVDVFDLSLEETRLYSRSQGFEVVGHSYFKGPWLT